MRTLVMRCAMGGSLVVERDCGGRVDRGEREGE